MSSESSDAVPTWSSGSYAQPAGKRKLTAAERTVSMRSASKVRPLGKVWYATLGGTTGSFPKGGGNGRPPSTERVRRLEGRGHLTEAQALVQTHRPLVVGGHVEVNPAQAQLRKPMQRLQDQCRAEAA